MGNQVKIYKIIEEYVLEVPEVSEVIKSRISRKDINYNDGLGAKTQYFWDISHYCKGQEAAATAYVPSVRYDESLELCRKMLFLYMNNFTNIGIEKNKLY